MVKQYDFNGNLLNTFASINEASELTNISERKIKRCLSGETSTASGFIWKEFQDAGFAYADYHTNNNDDLTNQVRSLIEINNKLLENISKLTHPTTHESKNLQKIVAPDHNQKGLHVVMGCIHLPAHNKQMWSAVLDLLSDIKSDIKGIHLIGDILDCNSLSLHNLGDISTTTLGEEYRLANIALDELDSVLPTNIEKNYIWGNHEERYTRLLSKVDISKFGKALLSPTNGCRFVERGYSVQESYKNSFIQLGKYLDLIHGEYTSMNPAKKHLDVYKRSVMFAHTHTMDSYYDSDKASFNIGWMGDKDHPFFSYASRISKTKWQNGFAIVNIDEEGYYHVQQIHWYNNKFYYGGKCYK